MCIVLWFSCLNRIHILTSLCSFEGDISAADVNDLITAALSLITVKPANCRVLAIAREETLRCIGTTGYQFHYS